MVSCVAVGLGQGICIHVSSGACAWVCSCAQMCLSMGLDFGVCARVSLGAHIWHLRVHVWACAGMSVQLHFHLHLAGTVRKTKECTSRNPDFSRAREVKVRTILLFSNLVTWNKGGASFIPMLLT